MKKFCYEHILFVSKNTNKSDSSKDLYRIVHLLEIERFSKDMDGDNSKI